LGKLASKLSDQETRDGWWQELRDEIRSHANTLGCSHVIGYAEASTIHDDVCVLSLTGTAATVRGLPDLTQEHDVWMALEQRMLEGEHNSLWKRRNPLTENSTPGVVGGYVNTPYEHVVNEEGEEVVLNEDNSTEASMNGQLVGDKEILEQGMPLSRKMMRRQKHEQRLERRYHRSVRDKMKETGQMKQNGKNGSTRSFGIDDSVSGTCLVRARPARPCSYCHVPYHHKFAPFKNMKLVPW